MTCPRCYAEFEPSPRACPECGVRLVRNIAGMMKTSSVMITSGDEPAFYRSVQDVPEPLRSQLIESTQSANSGTIVIADRAGKDQITQVIARRENAKHRRSLKAGPGDRVEGSEKEIPWPAAYLRRKFLGYSWVVWAGVLLFLAAAGVIASVFAMHS